MSIAIIVHSEANGVNGGPLATLGVENTYYAHKLTDMLVNENNSTVLAFRNYAEAINPNQFDLSPGNYRITADITLCKYNNVQTVSVGARCGLYNVTRGDFQYQFGSTTEQVLSNSVQVSSTGSHELNILLHLEGMFSVSSAVNSFELREVIYVNGSTTPTSDDVLGDKSTVTASTLKEYYAFIKILKMT